MTSGSFAQTFGVKAGFNLSNMLIKKSEVFLPYITNKGEYKMNPGFHLGASLEFPVYKLFTLEADLLLTDTGSKIITEEPFGATTLRQRKKVIFYFCIFL